MEIIVRWLLVIAVWKMTAREFVAIVVCLIKRKKEFGPAAVFIRSSVGIIEDSSYFFGKKNILWLEYIFKIVVAIRFYFGVFFFLNGAVFVRSIGCERECLVSYALC